MKGVYEYLLNVENAWDEIDDGWVVEGPSKNITEMEVESNWTDEKW